MTPYESAQTQSNSLHPETQAVKPIDLYDDNTSKLFDVYDQNKFLFIFLLCLIVTIANIMETWTLIGFLLPMDWILFAASLFLVWQWAWLMLFVVFIVCVISTCIWDFLWYYTWYKLGSKLYDRPDTRYFKKKYLLEWQDYFKKYGERVFYIGRFISIGSVMPTLLGAFKMNLLSFLTHSFLSSVIWVLTIMVPTALIWIIRPTATSDWRVIWFLTIVVYTMPEIVAWLILFKEPAKEYFDRLKWAQTEINQIRESFGDIADSVIDIFNKVKNWQDQTAWCTETWQSKEGNV